MNLLNADESHTGKEILNSDGAFQTKELTPEEARKTMEEPLIKLKRKFSDREKLLHCRRDFEKLQNKLNETKNELGIVRSERDEYKYILNQESLILKLKSLDMYKQIKSGNKSLREKNRHLQKTNSELIAKLVSKERALLTEFANFIYMEGLTCGVPDEYIDSFLA